MGRQHEPATTRRRSARRLGIAGLVGGSALAAALAIGPPKTPPNQSMDPLARAATLAYYRAGVIPRDDGRGWLTRGPRFKASVTRETVPAERAALRRYWAGPELRVLQYGVSPGWTPSCCTAVWNVRTQSYRRVKSATVSAVTLDKRETFHNAIEIRITERSRIMWATRDRGVRGQRHVTWHHATGSQWIDLTFARVRGRLRAVDVLFQGETNPV